MAEAVGNLLPGNVIAHTRQIDEKLLAQKLDADIPDNSKIRINAVVVVGYCVADPAQMRCVIVYRDIDSNLAVAAPWDVSLAYIIRCGALVSD